MKNVRNVFLALALATTSVTGLCLPTAANAQSNSVAGLNADCRAALERLYDTHPFARRLGHEAKAILIFPNIVKAGFVFGGAYGEGELISGDQVLGYYNTVQGSWGLQIGVQSYGYALFLMTDHALHYLRESEGWEIGAGPTVVVVNEGMEKDLSTATLNSDAYAFVFNQQGLMGGITINGTKISHIHPG